MYLISFCKEDIAMSEKKGLFASLFGGSKSGGCCNMEIVEESKKKGGCCDMQIVEDNSQEETGEAKNP